MPRSLFEELMPARGGPTRWRALPLSMALHGIAGAAVVTFVVRPIVSADEEGPRGPVRYAVDAPAPVPVAARPALPRAHRNAVPNAATVAPPPAALPIDPAPLLPGILDETPSVCLTNCGDGAPGSPGSGTDGGAGSGTAGDGPMGNGAPLPIGGDLRPPRKTHHVLPDYPELAKRVRLGGLVIVQCVIDVEGRVSDARVLRGHPLLDAAALDAVRQWRYEPTRLNGQAVPVVMTVTVTFISPR